MSKFGDEIDKEKQERTKSLVLDMDLKLDQNANFKEDNKDSDKVKEAEEFIEGVGDFTRSDIEKNGKSVLNKLSELFNGKNNEEIDKEQQSNSKEQKQEDVER